MAKLSTKETVIREIRKRVLADLYREADDRPLLNGPLGEQIAMAAGSYSLMFTTPEELAKGIVSWLDKYFLNSPPQSDQCGPREGTEDASCPPSIENGGGSRASRSTSRTGPST